MAKENIILFFWVSCLLLSCNSKRKENEEYLKKRKPEMVFANMPYSDQLDDSINFYKLKIDNVIGRYIERMSGAKDSSANEMVRILSDYRKTYKSNIERTGRLMYLASGLQKDDFRNQKKIEYYSIVCEHEKIKSILSEICGNYFESGIITADSLNRVPECLYDF